MPGWGQGLQDSGDWLPLLLQLQAMRQRNAESQFGTSVQQASPGTTYGQLGLDDKTLKRALGRVPKADEVAKPMTAQHMVNQRVLQLIDSSPPDFINTLAATTAATQAGAPSGLYTSQGVVDSAKANEAEAGTARKVAETTSGKKVEAAQATANTQATSAQFVSQAVEEGMNAWKGFSPEVRKALGSKALTGTTESEVQSTEVNNQLKTALTKEALKATIDPKHPANAFFRGLGINPAAGYAMIGMGADQLLTLQAQITLASSSGRSEAESALAKANASWAEEMGKRFGIAPEMVLRGIDKIIKQGGEPKGPFEQVLSNAMEVTYKASLTKAMEEGDPEISSLSTLVSAGQKLAGDPSALAQVVAAQNRKAAEIYLRQRGIQRPVDGDAQGLAAYNNLVTETAKRFSTFNSRLFGQKFEFKPPKNGTVQMAPKDAAGGMPQIGAGMQGLNPPAGQGGMVQNKLTLQVPAGLAPDTAKVVQDFLDAIGIKQP